MRRNSTYVGDFRERNSFARRLTPFMLVVSFHVLAFGSAVNCSLVKAQIFLDESTRIPLLIEGTSRCTESNLTGSEPGSVLKFAVACNRDSAIFAWDIPKQDANDRNEYISFAFSDNASKVQLLCKSDSPASLIKEPKRTRLLLLEGKKAQNSAFACPSVFSRFGIGVFLGSDDLGFNFETLEDGMSRGESSIQLPTGILSWVHSGDLIESIEFTQNDESIFSSLDENKTPVGKVTLPMEQSSELLVRRRFAIHFDKPVSPSPTAPWSANAVLEYRGVAEGIVSAAYDIKISVVNRDEESVRAAIEKAKDLIPDGANIAPIDAVAKQWKDGRVEPVIDENAVEAADSVVWGSASNDYLPAVLLVLLFVVAGGTWLFRKSTG